ncbi:hypothetical protein [Streptomyces sp. NPDC005303]|uniref:hypothetical protein n=1 Tax=Streptomyces sp. NPDC005303 TaxID=3155713 RepID=UPI0033A46DB4
MAAQRRTLKEYVLGPDRPTSMERFEAAVDDLADRSTTERTEDLPAPLVRQHPRIAPDLRGGRKTRACRPEVGTR